MDCDRCENEIQTSSTRVSIEDVDYALCENCERSVRDEIEKPHWYDRFTNDHYEAAVDYLEDIEQVWCVHGDTPQSGDIIVHSPYLDAAVVQDVMDNFSMQLDYVHCVLPKSYDGEFDCVSNHGPCVEYFLDYRKGVKPLPVKALEESEMNNYEYVGQRERIDAVGALAKQYWDSKDLTDTNYNTEL